MTYIYSDSTAVVGPLATSREPHSYDLCSTHGERLTAPRGWDLVRHQGDYTVPMPTDDDLVALANAVREAARPELDISPDMASGTGHPTTGSTATGSIDRGPATARHGAHEEPLTAAEGNHGRGASERLRPRRGDATSRGHLRVVSTEED